MRPSLLRTLLTLSLAQHAAGAQVSRASIAARVDSIVASFRDGGGPSAVSIAVARSNDTLIFGGWGLADRVRNVAATAETPYHIASITKQFTAALVMRLVDRGRVALADSIGAHVPGLPPAWRRVTIDQVLQHTSGIPDDGLDEFRWSEAMTPAENLLVRALTDSLAFAPGTQWRYSNTGYIALGMLLERAYGAPFDAVVRRELTEPLGLSHTGYCPATPGQNGQALGYNRNGADFVPAAVLHVSQEHAAGGLCSTVGDLLAWNRALHGGRVLSRASYEAMITPHGAATASGYGFAVERRSYLGRAALEHGGNVFGFVSFDIYFPADSLSIIVLTNTDPLPGGRAFFIPDLLRVATGAPVRIPALSVPVAPEQLLAYSGQYTLALPNRQAALQVLVEGNHLIAQVDGQAPIPLRSIGEHRFIAPSGMIQFTFVVDGKAVPSLTLEQNGMRFQALRR